MMARTNGPETATPDPVVAVIDDDPLYLQYLQGILAMEGLRRVKAIDARHDMSSHIRGARADCFVIDYDLGDDNGFNVATRILNEREDPPALVMMTGTGSEQTVIKAMRVGFCDYVSKRTLTGGELRGAITRAVAARGASRARPAQESLEDAGSAMGLQTREGMEGLLAQFCGAEHRRAFSFGLVQGTNLDAVAESFGAAAREKARASLVAALRRSRGTVGHVAGWDRDCFAWLSDADATPAAFAAMMRGLPDALQSNVTLDGGWARVEARAGALLLPNGVHDPREVALAAEALLREADEADEPSRHEIRGGRTIEPPTGAETSERRRDRRMRCLKLARLIPEGDRTLVDCVVTNQSSRGACLKTKTFFVAPERFKVAVVGAGEQRWATLRWQKGEMMGVEYEERVH